MSPEKRKSTNEKKERKKWLAKRSPPIPSYAQKQEEEDEEKKSLPKPVSPYSAPTELGSSELTFDTKVKLVFFAKLTTVGFSPFSKRKKEREKGDTCCLTYLISRRLRRRTFYFHRSTRGVGRQLDGDCIASSFLAVPLGFPWTVRAPHGEKT